MDERAIELEIIKLREKLYRLASSKENPLVDEEIYNLSCQLDNLVVAHTKLKMKKITLNN